MLIINGIYEIVHEHDGKAWIRVLSLSDDGVMARVEMIDPLASTFQLAIGAVFKVVITRCTFTLIQ